MNARFLFAISLILLASNKLAAQRRVPIGALPTYYNGGFAGESGVPRAAGFYYLSHTFNNVFNQGYSRHNSNRAFLSVDHFIKRYSTGVGITSGVESAESYGSYRGNFVSLAISPKMSFKGKYTFAPFADIAYERTAVKLGNNVYDPLIPSSFVVDDVKIRTGFLVNSSRAYLGMSAVVATYGKGFSTFKGKWTTFSAMTLTFQAGYTFQQDPDSKFSFTPQLAITSDRLNYRYDSVSQKILKRNVITLQDLNLMFRYDKWIAGMNSMGFVLGYQTNTFKVQLTNSYTRRGREEKSIELSDKNVFLIRPGSISAGQYVGSISLRYVFRNNESPKMPGFNQ